MARQRIRFLLTFLAGVIAAATVATFSESMSIRAAGRYDHLDLFTNVLDHVRRKLDIEPHETTDDGKFTLLAMECLGSCDTAPVALVNDKLYEGLTIEQLDEVIENLPS